MPEVTQDGEGAPQKKKTVKKVRVPTQEFTMEAPKDGVQGILGQLGQREIDPQTGKLVGPVPGTTMDPDLAIPCFVKGFGAGFASFVLGWIFGFGKTVFTHRGGGRLNACWREGVSSGKGFALVGGLYSAFGCYSQRLRQKDDAVNSAVAGCATGLALGYAGGPIMAGQSCLGFAAFSYFFDRWSANNDKAVAAEMGCGGAEAAGRRAAAGTVRGLGRAMAGAAVRARAAHEALSAPVVDVDLLLKSAFHMLQPCRGQGCFVSVGPRDVPRLD
ncbi:unnamed protein product [Pedinophyceae sp. YPF-701]|nr:unnamed protein product [Pedinophyceae sp. YPF-701]